MTVGFAGTRAGMSRAQKDQLAYVLALFRHADKVVDRVPVFVDGDCPDGGADQEARAIAEEHGCICRQEPPKDRTAKELLARDRRIAQRCDVLVAAPSTDKEQLRSGTWTTVRYARRAGKPVVMLSRGEQR